MAASKKDAAGVTFYPAEGVWRDGGGKVVDEGEPVSNPTPSFDAPSGIVQSEPNVGPPAPSAPAGS